jgi:hypothetical protein
LSAAVAGVFGIGIDDAAGSRSRAF